MLRFVLNKRLCRTREFRFVQFTVITFTTQPMSLMGALIKDVLRKSLSILSYNDEQT